MGSLLSYSNGIAKTLPFWFQSGAGAAVGASPFQDEIFQWPIATLNNVHVWNLIFTKYVTDPTDQHNLIVASPQFFEPLLKESQCSNLFGEVVDLLHRRHYLTLSKQQFLNLRRLSKSCKISIDRILGPKNSCFLHTDGIDHDTFDEQHVCWRSSITVQKLKEKMKVAEHQFGGIFSTLVFTAADVRRHSNFQTVLSSVGSQIHHAEIRLNYRPTDWDWHENCQLLSLVLGSMPNLTSLKIVGSYHLKEGREKPLDLYGYADANPLPVLNHLIFLNVVRLPEVLVNILLETYAENLKKLSVSSFCILDRRLYSSHLLSLTNNLSELWLSAPTNAILLATLSGNVKWPCTLKSVSFEISVEQGVGNQDFEKLCVTLFQQFGRGICRLHTLNLLLTTGMIDGPFPLISSDVRIRLPGLRRLWIDSRHVSFSTIDFILGLWDSLEELVLNIEWVQRHRTQKNRVELILFVGYWHRMYESNIWEKMPKLQKITIRTCSSYYIPGNAASPLTCYEYFRPISI